MKFLKILRDIFLYLLVTVVILVLGLLGAVYLFEKGPSEAAKETFVRTAQETGEMKFLAKIFLSDEEVAAIMNVDEDVTYELDTSLIEIPAETVSSDEGPYTDQWGLCDEDGDGIIIENIKGNGFHGVLMVILDPTRVILAYEPGTGLEVEDWCIKYNAVGGINAGGFSDQLGSNSGRIPTALVAYEGKYYNGRSVNGFAGIDDNGILHVGSFTADELAEAGVQYGTGFGPVLISNGEEADNLDSGLNPRTAIGQRSDGAILLIVIEGRNASSLGASYRDVADVLLDYGAVNACNMDGGGSSMMWFDGDYITELSSVIGMTTVPTAFIVLPQDSGSEG